MSTFADAIYQTKTFGKFVQFYHFLTKRGGAVPESVERATPGEEVPGSISAVAWLGRCQYSVTG